MKLTNKLTASLAALVIATASASSLNAQEEGGYVYNRGEDRFIDNVYNFIKHFNYDQYYWCQDYQFTSSNNYFVDAMDFSYYSGHGGNWTLGMGPGASSYSVSLGSSTKWGDRDLEFVVFQSCKVVPSPLDVSRWWERWIGSNGVFQGLHQAVGYRTNSNSGNGISNNFGNRIAAGQAVWQSWFNAVNDERAWWRGRDYPGYASVVLYPGLDYDVYPSYAYDPPAGHGSLRIYYQH